MMADVGYLQEDNGNKSCMRLQCLMAMIGAIALSALIMFRGDPGGSGLYLVGMFLTASIGGKAAQKWMEAPASPHAQEPANGPHGTFTPLS
jgi:hypothetical protein